MKRLHSMHYGWVIAATGVLVLFTCIGLARFSYTALIPGMHTGLHLGYDRLGYIGTSNFIGYLVAVFITPFMNRRYKSRLTIVLGLLLIGVCMIGMSYSNGFAAIFILFTLVGLGSGLANIPMMTLTTNWFAKEQRGKAAGLVICGNGLGIIFVGYLVPLFNRLFENEGWRYGWRVFGLISLAIAVCAGLTLCNTPAEKRLKPVGWSETAGCRQFHTIETSNAGGILFRLGILYLIFGVTVMVYGTFIVTTMIKEYGLSEQRSGLFLSWIGFFSFFSGIAFGALSDKIGRKFGLLAVFTVQTLAYLLAGLNLGNAGLAASITLYGLSVFAPPAIVAAAIGDYFSTPRVARAFSNVTFFFAIGQTIGPAGAGLLAGESGLFSTAYLCAAVLTAAAGIFALTLPSAQGPNETR